MSLIIGLVVTAVTPVLASRSTSTTAWTNANATTAVGTLLNGPTATITLAPSSANSLFYNSPPATSTIAGRGGASSMFTPNLATTTSTIAVSPSVQGCTLGVNAICQRGTMTILFSQPLFNPTIHLTGFGGNNTDTEFSTRLTLTGSSPAGATLGSMSSGATNMQITSGNRIGVITNNGITGCTTSGASSGCSSVQINGTVTSVTFDVSLIFAGGSGTTSQTSRETFDITVTAGEDFSDAPTTNFNSAQAPTHLLSDLRLGSSVDEDNATVVNSTTSLFPVSAGADNNGSNGDGTDEDAVSSFPSMAISTTSYSLTVPISGASKAGTVCGWIDFNRNNTFVATERACSAFSAGDTSVILNWNSASSNAPTGLTVGNNYVRLRAGYTTAQIQTADGKGAADSGEVEDYRISVTLNPTAAHGEISGTVRDTNGNPLKRVPMKLFNLQNGVVKHVLTNQNGVYLFPNNLVGQAYLVEPDVMTGGEFTPANKLIQLIDGVDDTDFVRNGGRSLQRQPFNDFDGDGKFDAAVFRESEGNWYIRQSSDESMKVIRWGITGDIPVAADYDGDGITDVAVYRGGTWYILQSNDGQIRGLQFGLAEDKPVIADYDGDGRADIAVYRPSTGIWYLLESENNNAFRAVRFGLAEDIPTAEDFDGDSKADVAIYRPSEGRWYILKSESGEVKNVRFGLPSDNPVAADYDGDGKSDIAVYRASTGVWYRINSSNGEVISNQKGGNAEDIALTGDVDGDEKSNTIIYRNGRWLIVGSQNQSQTEFDFGLSTDKPVVLR